MRIFSLYIPVILLLLAGSALAADNPSRVRPSVAVGPVGAPWHTLRMTAKFPPPFNEVTVIFHQHKKDHVWQITGMSVAFNGYAKRVKKYLLKGIKAPNYPEMYYFYKNLKNGELTELDIMIEYGSPLKRTTPLCPASSSSCTSYPVVIFKVSQNYQVTRKNSIITK